MPLCHKTLPFVLKTRLCVVCVAECVITNKQATCVAFDNTKSHISLCYMNVTMPSHRQTILTIGAPPPQPPAPPIPPPPTTLDTDFFLPSSTNMSTSMTNTFSIHAEETCDGPIREAWEETAPGGPVQNMSRRCRHRQRRLPHNKCHEPSPSSNIITTFRSPSASASSSGRT